MRCKACDNIMPAKGDEELCPTCMRWVWETLYWWNPATRVEDTETLEEYLSRNQPEYHETS